MYRLFCNNRTLVCRNFFEQCLDAEINDSVYSTQVFENTFDMIKKWLDEGDENLEINDVDNDILAAVIKKIFRFAPAAGGLVLINNAIAAIERNGIPDLPKGHIEKNESPDVAALREVREETALSNLSIIKQLPSTFHCYLLNDQWTLKRYKDAERNNKEPWDELEKSIIANLADDLTVGVKGRQATIVVTKKFA